MHATTKPNNAVLYKTTDRFVDLLKDQFNTIASNGDDHSKHSESQYQHDFDAFNAMVNVIKENNSIDWVDLKMSFQTATLAVKKTSKSDVCEVAWKRLQTVDNLINNAQRELMIYRPYALPNIEHDDIELLKQFQKGYQKAFNSQTEVICADWKPLNDHERMHKMKETFETNVKEMKWKALEKYLNELNELGETNHLPMVHN